MFEERLAAVTVSSSRLLLQNGDVTTHARYRNETEGWFDYMKCPGTKPIELMKVNSRPPLKSARSASSLLQHGQQQQQQQQLSNSRSRSRCRRLLPVHTVHAPAACSHPGVLAAFQWGQRDNEVLDTVSIYLFNYVTHSILPQVLHELERCQPPKPPNQHTGLGILHGPVCRL